MSLTGLIVGLALAAAPQAPSPLDPNLPSPAPDPVAWWSPETARPSSEVDPLYGRRLGRREEPIPIANGVEPLLYRLWGLQPLQNQLVRRGEMVLEVWARPSRGVTGIRRPLEVRGQSWIGRREAAEIRRDRVDLGVGNVLGSNLFNLLILGLAWPQALLPLALGPHPQRITRHPVNSNDPEGATP